MSKERSLDLSRRDRQRVDELLHGGVQSVRTVLRALALRQMDEGETTPAVNARLGLSEKAVWRLASATGMAVWTVRCSRARVRGKRRR